MAAKENQGNESSLFNVIPSGGLHTDSSLVNQPSGTTRFVMTGVDETKEGDLGTISTEESNQECYDLTSAGLEFGYVPIGKCYIGEEQNILMLANPITGNSAIVILNKDCSLEVKATDQNQSEKFNFKVDHQIDITFRLRRGCERVIYWVDPKPRMFILDKEEEFKNSAGEWDISKFNLFKTYKSIPEIEDILVLDAGGNIPAGSYNATIRYLDEDFNPTEFILTTETIMIYNSPSSSIYREIEGTTKETAPYYNYANSNKAIKITLAADSLDQGYPFYQVGIIEANTGSGLITDVKFSALISTKQNTFIYTGSNYESIGSLQEVTIFNNIVEKAEHIEQLENRLILGNVKGKNINFCSLQKYASKINSDMVTKEVFVSVNDLGNSKDPAAHFNGIGYMPGEIYSFGIVYVFKDNSISPTYHIPGKSNLANNADIYTPGNNVYPMSNIKNYCTNTKYTDNNSCNSDSYWGKDFLGNSLLNQRVRHHRFPLRTDLNLPFVEKINSNEANEYVKVINIKAVKNNAQIPLTCSSTDSSCTPVDADFGDPVTKGSFEIKLEYSEDSNTRYESNVINPFVYAEEVGTTVTTANVSYNFTSPAIYGTVVAVISLKEVFESSENTVSLTFSTDPVTGQLQYTGTSSITGITYSSTIGESVNNSSEELYKATLFGIKFSNIVLPSAEDLNGEEIIGYYIVRNERKESDKTILDSAVLLPTLKERNFVSQGLLFPQLTVNEANARIKKDFLGFVSPEHKFNNTQYSSFSKIIHQGNFKKTEAIKSRVKLNDIADGSGFVDGKHKEGERDVDGFSLHIKTRDNLTEFKSVKEFEYSTPEIKKIFYLDALEDKLVEDSQEISTDVFNLACDNKIGIISLKENYNLDIINNLPYVYLNREESEPYANFRTTPYYKESKNLHKFTSESNTCEIFNGDSYINSMRYVNSIYYDTRMKRRAGKTSVWNIIVGVILVVGAIVATIFSFGATSPLVAGALAISAGLAAGVGTTLGLSGIKQAAWNRAYNQLYSEGLRETVTDNYLLYDIDPINGADRGNLKNPSDDEIQWLGDCVNLWFESSVNIGLRHGFNDGTPSYLKAPGKIEQGTLYSEWDREYFGIHSVGSGGIREGERDLDVPPTTALDFHMTFKLTKLNIARKNGKEAYGIALAEAYLLNPDYKRRNKEKIFNHLGLEYDCCSDCVETFSHRWHWSEQSFQEELTDNFRTFLPNNYKDLEGETGTITDIFRIGNNLFLHTEEGLWYCPQTFQERVTGDVISFIGTGEYFSIPPRKIVDDHNSSAGTKHKWGRTKTKHGVLFPSWKEKKWYLFNGEKLEPISDNGNYSFFKVNMDFEIEKQYFSTNGIDYPYSNNPSNSIGVGFISTYDTNKERLIVTKKDFKLNIDLPEGFLLCNDVIILNAQEIIETKTEQGWEYIGLEDCKMKFKKTTSSTETIIKQIKVYHPEETITETIPSCGPAILSATTNDSASNTGGCERYSYGYTLCDGTVVTLGSGCADYQSVVTISMSNLPCGASPWSEGLGGTFSIVEDTTTNCDTTITTVIPGYYTTEEIEVQETTTNVEYSLEEGETVELKDVYTNASWTMSYSLKRQEWKSWHPYLPSFYLHNQERFYSWPQGSQYLWKHNRQGHYRTFYNKTYPFIVEFVDNPQLLNTKVWHHIMFQSEAKEFKPETKDYNDVRDVTFNKVLFYNTEQISGLLNIVFKNNSNQNYLLQQVTDTLPLSSILIDRNERDWTLNDMRDIRQNLNVSMFIKELEALQNNYFIDKIVNPASLNPLKSWSELESFRDKFLVIRLIFDTFDTNKRLTFYYSSLNKNISER